MTGQEDGAAPLQGKDVIAGRAEYASGLSFSVKPTGGILGAINVLAVNLMPVRTPSSYLFQFDSSNRAR
jgi:hypothetical protein